MDHARTFYHYLLGWPEEGLPNVVSRGAAIFIGDNPETVPTAFHLHMLERRRLYDHVIFLTVATASTAHVASRELVQIDRPPVCTSASCLLHFLTVQFGFCDDSNVPQALHDAWTNGQLAFDPRNACYVCADQLVLLDRNKRGMRGLWKRLLFYALAKRQTSVTEHLRLPAAKTFKYCVPVLI
jgi:K+ transporter